MKSLKPFLILLIPVLLASCGKSYDEEDSYYPQSEYIPVLMKYDDLLASVVQLPAKQIKKPGKIYVYNDYLFIVEKYRGFHVINNSNPASPVNTAFMSVPGCIDIAVKDDILYADNATDLVSININDKSNMFQAGRVPNIFPELLPPNNTTIPYWFNKENRPLNTVIVGLTSKNESL